MGKKAIIDITIPNDRLALYASLKEKYNPEGSKIRNYQHHLVDTLVEFNKFCQKHQIQYSLAYGTMLGAIRHKGFIPWDDDADILMTRDNYEKLLSLLNGPWNMLNDKIGLAMGIRPSIWMAPYSYIDVFVLDSSPATWVARKIKQTLAELLYCVVKSRGRLDATPIRVDKWFIFAPIAFFCSREKWMKLWTKLSYWQNDNPNSTRVQAFNNVLSYIPQCFSKKDIGDYVLCDFEGYLFPIFSGYDEMLKECYGDYMQLPKDLHVHGYTEKFNDDASK